MLFNKDEYVKIKKLHDSVKDSDALKKLAYEFGKMGSYFDRANSPQSREILAREDEPKYKEFVRLAIQIKAQLQREVANMKNQVIPADISKAWERDIHPLLHDGFNRLYWAATNRRDKVGQKLADEIGQLTSDYADILESGSDKWQEQKRKEYLAKKGKLDSKVKDYTDFAIIQYLQKAISTIKAKDYASTRELLQFILKDLANR